MLLLNASELTVTSKVVHCASVIIIRIVKDIVYHTKIPR